ncbi:MAG: ATP-binding protein [Christensenella sp.]|uniref:ATP-binding protein n=1 Tax=Christensenella sp. TaxID=1935934 RepID=UPI002B207C53|nr:ATP-binding protein [Christensenella sp.]MEA5003155.1 ATP-binding protein [Christensenella sp.]
MTDIQVRIYTNRIEIESTGKLPGHITPLNILKEQYSRNARLVRLISRFPSPTNKDAGEGLNAAFEAMMKMQLQRPQIVKNDTSVLVIIKHERLADADTIVLEYLKVHNTISNSIARKLTGISDANKMKRVFNRLKERGRLERVPGKRSSASEWQPIIEKNTNGNGGKERFEQVTFLE